MLKLDQWKGRCGIGYAAEITRWCSLPSTVHGPRSLWPEEVEKSPGNKLATWRRISLGFAIILPFQFTRHGGLVVNLVSVYYEYQQRAEVETRETKVEKGYKILGMGSLLLHLGFVRNSRWLHTHKLPLVLSVNLCCNTDITPSREQFNSIHGRMDRPDRMGLSTTCRIFTFVGPTFNLPGWLCRYCH